MNRLFIFATYVLSLLSIEPMLAQSQELNDNSIHLVAERVPILERGGGVFKDWLQSEVYTPYENMQTNETGELLVSFVVEKNGEVSSVEILCSPSREISEIVRSAMCMAPAFKPAMSGGRAVRFSLTYVISFIAEMSDVTIVSGVDNPYGSTQESSLEESHGFSFSTEQDSTYVEFNQMVNESIFSDKTNIEDEMLVKSIEVRDFDINKSEDRALYPGGVLTSTRQPRTMSGAPYVEYLDWVFDNIHLSRRSVLSKNSTVDGQLTLTMIHEVDGSLSSLNVISSSDERLSNDVVELFNTLAQTTPAQRDNLLVSYRSCVTFSFKRLRERARVSFSSEVRSAIASDTPVGLEYVDVLPTYDGEVIDTFLFRLSELCYEMLPVELRDVSATVGVRVTLGKDGRVLGVESYGSGNEQIEAIVDKALLQMPALWSPARVYDSSVGSIFSGVVIFSPKRRLR